MPKSKQPRKPSVTTISKEKTVSLIRRRSFDVLISTRSINCTEKLLGRHHLLLFIVLVKQS